MALEVLGTIRVDEESVTNSNLGDINTHQLRGCRGGDSIYTAYRMDTFSP